MRVDKIKNGVVIDHIACGRAMRLYTMLGLDKLDCPVAILKNVQSGKMGRKDIIKLDEIVPLDLDVLGCVSPEATVVVIRNEAVVEKKYLTRPETLINVLFCTNPSCVTSAEREIPHMFRLTNREKGVYRCVYCDAKAQE